MQHALTPMSPSQPHVEYQVTDVASDFGVIASSTQKAAFKSSCNLHSNELTLLYPQEEYDSSLYLCWLGFIWVGACFC